MVTAPRFLIFALKNVWTDTIFVYPLTRRAVQFESLHHVQCTDHSFKSLSKIIVILTCITSTESETTRFNRVRRLRSAFNDLEVEDWIDNLDDYDIDYFYNLMVNGKMDDIMDAFRYDMKYDDYGEYNDYDRYYDDYYGFEGYGEYDEEMAIQVPPAAAPEQVCP